MRIVEKKGARVVAGAAEAWDTADGELVLRWCPPELASRLVAVASAAQAIEFAVAGVPWAVYVRLREHGATHDETIQARRERCDLWDYAEARRAGATHDEVMTLHHLGDDLADYIGAVADGMDPEDLARVIDRKGDISTYTFARHEGLGHDEALDRAVGKRMERIVNAVTAPRRGRPFTSGCIVPPYFHINERKKWVERQQLVRRLLLGSDEDMDATDERG